MVRTCIRTGEDGCFLSAVVLGGIALIWWLRQPWSAPRPPSRTTLFTVHSGARQGAPVGPVGDVNRDGRIDFLLGGEVFSGRDGSVLSVDPIPDITSTVIGDVDGDGVEDKQVGGTCKHRDGIAEYTAIISGRTGEELGRVKHELSIFRTWSAPIGDVNADGMSDLVVPGERRKYYVVSGAAMIGR